MGVQKMFEILPLTWFIFVVLGVVTLGGVYLVAWTARCFAYQVAIDILELINRYAQTKLDIRQQSIELELKNEEAQAKLEDWRKVAYLRRQSQRQQLLAGGTDES
jgi:hypothetical protein